MTQYPDCPAVVAAYCRVSGEEQGAKNNPIPSQRAECSRACRRCFGDDGFSIEWFVDEALSGTLGPAGEGDSGKSRPAFTRLIEAVRAGRVDYVCCQDLDRIARDEADAFNFGKLLAENEIRILTPDRTYDLREPHDAMAYGMQHVFAAFQPRQTSVKARAGKIQRARRGLPKSGRAPYGWRLQTVREASDPNERTLVPVPEEVKWVKTMADLYRRGRGYGRIARHLQREGAPPPGTAGWYTAVVRHSLRNCKHAGLIEVEDGQFVEGRHFQDRIYDPEIFHELRREMQHRAQLPGQHSASSYFLTGTLTCGQCGASMRASSHSIRRYYQHGSAWNDLGEPCERACCRADHLEAAALQAIRQFAQSDHIQRLVSDELDQLLSADDRELEEAAQRKERELQHAREQLQWLIAQAARRPDLREEFDEQVDAHRERIEQLAGELEHLQRRADDIEIRRRRAERVYDALQDFDAIWEGIDGDERRHLVYLVFDELALLPACAGHTLRMKVFLDEPQERFIPASKSSDRPKYGPRSLTPREGAGLYLTAQGLSLGEIAEQWGTTHQNVRSLLLRARRKLQAGTNEEAAAAARDHLGAVEPFLPLEGALEHAPAPEELTERERSLLADIANSDLTYGEIAKRHDIAEGTVKVHAANTARKLRANGRKQLISQVQRLGLLDDSEDDEDE